MIRSFLQRIGVLRRPKNLYRFPLISPGGGSQGYVDIRAYDKYSAIVASRFAVDTSAVLIGPPRIIETQ